MFPTEGPTAPARQSIPQTERPRRTARSDPPPSNTGAANTSASPRNTFHASSTAAYTVDGHTIPPSPRLAYGGQFDEMDDARDARQKRGERKRDESVDLPGGSRAFVNLGHEDDERRRG